uniref:Uncharacterized protein TCIL3000_11_16140 n=1 Tax=Trypanosoma congolense (strain IL3000) TaxID=1068625 RepID=G0V381_TRYCI|nr:unnamed protein product [Trypanosoma congolense IL3000]
MCSLDNIAKTKAMQCSRKAFSRSRTACKVLAPFLAFAICVHLFTDDCSNPVTTYRALPFLLLALLLLLLLLFSYFPSLTQVHAQHFFFFLLTFPCNYNLFSLNHKSHIDVTCELCCRPAAYLLLLLFDDGRCCIFVYIYIRPPECSVFPHINMYTKVFASLPLPTPSIASLYRVCRAYGGRQRH